MGRYFRALAIDFDGTLAESGLTRSDVLDAVRETRVAGRRVVLATGRILSELYTVLPDADEHFDAIVAENGAVISLEGTPRLLAPPVDFELDEALVRRAVTFRRGQVLIAARAAQDVALTETIRLLGLECQLVRNRDELMVLPPGISKGFGVYQALGDLGVSHHSTIAIGDAENDHSLLATCELGVAVGNAVDALKRHADLVLPQAGGEGVLSLLRGPLLRGELRLPPRRWQVELGRDAEGVAVRIPASQVNVLVTGRSKSGKSFLAGGLAEQLISLGYSLCIIDPEGDYAPLGRLRGVLTLGGRDPLPPADRIGRLIEHRFGSVLVDVSLLEPKQRAPYVRALLEQLYRERESTGLPHWILIDEAHVAGAEGEACPFDASRKGHCLVTYRPREIRPDTWKHIDAVLVLPEGKEAGPGGDGDPVAVVEEVLQVSLGPALDAAKLGQAILLRSDGVPRLFTVAPRSTPHVRHWHKYAEANLPASLHFWFRNGAGQAHGAAANMEQFHGALLRCAAGVIRYHSRRGDLSRWIAESIHDARLARTVRALEERFRATAGADSDAEALRTALIGAVEDRYID
jgi:hydroxymethylpyrimidine pyrophosphatase-like HAD family hydrolase